MKPYSGRDGGHNAGYHSANGMVGMIHRITRLIELVPPPEKFLGKRSPAEQTKIHRASLSRGILVTIYVWPPLSSCWLSCFPINMNECQLTNKSIFCNEPISFFLCFCSFLGGLVISDISTQVDSTLVVKDVTQGRNTCPSVPSCGVSCFYMGRSGPPRSIVFGQEWQTKAEIPGQSGTSHHCVPKHTCPPISTKNDRDILSWLWDPSLECGLGVSDVWQCSSLYCILLSCYPVQCRVMQCVAIQCTLL